MPESSVNTPYAAASGELTAPALLAPRVRKLRWLQARVFFLTFLSYAIYSGTRQPYGITKSSLNPDREKQPHEPGYAPFNDENWGSTYLGACDTVFLSAYAVALFITGPMGDRVNLRMFLTVGMFGSGVFCVLFGLAPLMGIHALPWFIFANLGAGVFQATGWPACVTLMARWFGKGNRGTIMGWWNAQSSVGNMLGKLWSTLWLDLYGWDAAFIGAGALCVFVGFLMWAFIIPHPHDVLDEEELRALEELCSRGRIAKDSIVKKEDLEPAPAAQPALMPADGHVDSAVLGSSDNNGQLSQFSGPATTQAQPIRNNMMRHEDFEQVSFMTALRVPGVIEFSLCLFMSKLVVYAFTFWLPFFLSNLGYDEADAGNLSTVFDLGGVLGGVLAGWASDRSGRRGVVSVVFLVLSLPGLWVYNQFASHSLALNIILMFVAGALINGPYTLVVGVVAADLGSHPSLKGNPRGMSTVTGIVDGAGSVGAALQGVVIGVAGSYLGWTGVFYLLEGFCLLAALCLFRVVRKELSDWSCSSRSRSASSADASKLAAKQPLRNAGSRRSSESFPEHNGTNGTNGTNGVRNNNSASVPVLSPGSTSPRTLSLQQAHSPASQTPVFSSSQERQSFLSNNEPQ